MRPPQHNQTQPEPAPYATNTHAVTTNSTSASTSLEPQQTPKQALTTVTLPPLSTFYTSTCLLKTAITDVSEVQLLLKVTFSLMKGLNAHLLLKS